ncbi:MAG: UPF0149 family protein, partial [Mariprofundaceae bacterium]|nr:UPF0149 family protein [Mariprofundaceae bacterium]
MHSNNEKLVASLSYPGDALPEEALREAISRYDDIKPELHTALRLSPDEVAALESDAGETYMLQFFAMYLAAEKRDTATFPMIRDFFIQYGRDACEITGDLVTEHLDRILASVCGNDAKALKQAAELPGLYLWVRSAFFGALGQLHHAGLLSYEQILLWFNDWFEGDTLNQDERTCIAQFCCELSLKEMEKTLLSALAEGRIDQDSMHESDIREAMDDDEMPEHIRRHYGLVDDAVDLLRLWYGNEAFDELDSLYENEEKIALAQLLRAYNLRQQDEPVSMVFLHGYVFAVVLTPEPLSATEWLPNLFGGEIPPFDSIEDANAKLAVLMRLYNRLNQQRLDGLLHCPFDVGRGTGPDWLDMLRDWCRGFVLGTGLRPEYWIQTDDAPNAEEVNTAMMVLLGIADDTVIAEITGGRSDGSRSEKDNEFLARAILTLPDAVRVLTEHTQAQDIARVANMQPVRSNKVGRNAPCP